MEIYINTEALPEGYDINFHSREEWRSIHCENEGFLLVTPAGVKAFDVPQRHRSKVYDLMYEERQLALCAIALALLKKSPKTKKVDVLTWVAPSCGLVWNIFTGLPGVRPGATVGEVRKALKAKLTNYTEQVPAEPVSVPKSVTIKIRKKDLKKVRFADPAGRMLYCNIIGSPESDKSFSIRTKGGSVDYLAREEFNRSIFGLPYEQRFLAVAALLKRKLDALPEGTLVDAVEIFNFAPNRDEDTHLDGSSLFLPTPGPRAGKSISVDTWCAVIDSVLVMYTKPDAKEVVVELNDSDLGRVEFRDFDYRAPFDTFDVHSTPNIGFTVTFLDGTKKRFTPKGNHRSNIYSARFEDRPYAVAALAAEKAKSKTRNGLVTVALNEVTMGEARHAILDTTNDLLLPCTIEGINDLLAEKFHIKTVE